MSSSPGKGGRVRAVAQAILLTGIAWAAAPAQAQEATAAPVQALVTEALASSPTIRAARARLEAAQAAVGPAGALPDPMLMAGIMNQPIGGSEGEDMMAMRTIGVGQTLPYPGKLALQRQVAEAELAAANAQVEAARWAVTEEVKDAYYDLAFYDQALEIVRRNERLLTNFIQVTQSRYGVGTGSQADVLKARVEAARLAEEAVALTEQRRAALARLNAALDRPSDTPVADAVIPVQVARAAVPESAKEVQFTSAALGARAANSPLPPLVEVQEAAVRENPMIRAHRAMIAAQAARVDLARKAHLPDFDVSLQYGQRDGRSDVVSAVVSVPIPLRKGSKQDLEVKEAQARLAALEAEHHEQANELRARVAQAYADLERDRAQLALYMKSIIPQGRAALESATASFQVGRVDFLTLLENQTTLYNYETAYYRSLTQFAERLAELERIAGKEILR
jgi:cobalt-zinc-cadmium efflux system outer membrane protein